MFPNGPVWDVYYYTAPGRETEGGKSFLYFKSAEFRVPETLEESTGGRGSVVVGRLNKIAIFKFAIFKIPNF